ncbi:tyrosine-type recombinase/integrase [Kitasatospora sp. NPDC059646]|uniref:tyrosine-type recombinase/integrase n=1 Tax=Kitasatospora sp. NPDC059646 TaxID=3346893 RepID=UPI0036B4F3C7
MGRKATNNPRQMPSMQCGCPRCITEFPEPKRRRRRDCTGAWQARVYPPGEREYARNFENEDEAIAFLEKARTEIRERKWLDPRRGEIKISAWWELFQETMKNAEENTKARDVWAYTNYIGPRWGAQPLLAPSWLQIQTWVSGLEGPLVPSSISKVFQVMDRMMTAAVLDRRILSNPCDGVKLPKAKGKHPDDRRPPTYAQLWRVRACLPSYHHTLQIVAQETGLRWGELAGLRACWVDLAGARIKVREVLTETRGHLRRKAYPKSDAGLRTVPLTPLAVRVLRQHLAEEQPSTARTDPKDGLHPEELVFHGRNRRNRKGEAGRAPLRRSAFRRLWIKAIMDSGVGRQTVRTWKEEVLNPQTGRLVEVEKSRTDYWPDFHDQRHTVASRWHDRGVPEAVTQELLGHERGGEVTWLYTHAASDAAGQVLVAMADWKEARARREPHSRRLRVVA